MGNIDSSKIKHQEECINQMINFIKNNYIDEWTYMTKQHSIKCIKGKLRTIYNNIESDNTYLCHTKYKWYNHLKKYVYNKKKYY